MKTLKPLTRNLLILVCLAVVAVCAVAGSTDKGQAQASRPQVQNRTKTIEVVSLTEQDSSYLLKLRNNSAKTLNGYSLGVGIGSKLDVDLTIGETVIPPGGEFEESLPASRLRAQPQQTVNILAVLFTDGTSDGEPQVIADNQQRREGTKEQLKQILPLLRAALASDSTPDLVSLKKQIAELPSNSERGLSHPFNKGRSNAKQDTVSLLENLGGDPSTKRKRLTMLVEDIEKRVSRL